jgi:succinyl-diaminopimelate desuccinylase
MKRDLLHHARLALVALVFFAGCGSDDDDDRPTLERMLDQQFVSETSHLVTLQTYRTEDPQSEQRIVDNLTSARD